MQRSLVAYLFWVQRVTGSNPVILIKNTLNSLQYNTILTQQATGVSKKKHETRIKTFVFLFRAKKKKKGCLFQEPLFLKNCLFQESLFLKNCLFQEPLFFCLFQEPLKEDNKKRKEDNYLFQKHKVTTDKVLFQKRRKNRFCFKKKKKHQTNN